METGQKTIRKSNSKHKNDLNILSIQVSLNGLSFCILNLDKKTFTYSHQVDFDKKLTPMALLDQIKHQLNSEKSLQQEFKSVQLIYENELSSLVPKPLFDEDYLADYLKFNTRILQTDFITYDTIDVIDCVNVYVPYVNINNYFYEQFGEFKYHHFSSILLDKVLTLSKNNKDTKMYVHVAKTHFEIIVTDKNSLVLYNSFDYTSKEDFIYYILFTAEQLRLNPESIELILLGNISKNDALFNMAFKYVRNIELLIGTTDYKFDNTDKNFRNNFIQINSF